MREDRFICATNGRDGKKIWVIPIKHWCAAHMAAVWCVDEDWSPVILEGNSQVVANTFSIDVQSSLVHCSTDEGYRILFLFQFCTSVSFSSISVYPHIVLLMGWLSGLFFMASDVQSVPLCVLRSWSQFLKIFLCPLVGCLFFPFCSIFFSSVSLFLYPIDLKDACRSVSCRASTRSPYVAMWVYNAKDFWGE